MQPQNPQTLVRLLIGAHILAVGTVVVTTFAAVVVDIPLYPAMLVLGGVGLGMILTYTQHHNRGVRLLGLSALVFACAYYCCLYILDLPLSPLYVFVLAYAAVSIAIGFWLLTHLKRRT